MGLGRRIRFEGGEKNRFEPAGSNPFFSLQGELFARADSAERLTAAERRL